MLPKRRQAATQLQMYQVELTIWCIVFIRHHDYVCENPIGSVDVGGYCGQSKSGLCVFGKFCPIGLQL